MSSIELAKPAIDVGLATNDLEANERWLKEWRIPYDHLLKVGGGVHQHRYAVGDSVVKLNSHRGVLSAAPSGYVRLRLAAPVDGTRTFTTVDGVSVGAVPAGTDGVRGVEVTWRTADREAAAAFLSDGLGATGDGDRYRIGESLVVVEHDPDQPRSAGLDHLGFRYLTVQVRDVVAEHARILALGFDEGRPPVRLGDTACISFVLDRDGNWVELSQRASLTGPLPDLP